MLFWWAGCVKVLCVEVTKTIPRDRHGGGTLDKSGVREAVAVVHADGRNDAVVQFAALVRLIRLVDHF